MFTIKIEIKGLKEQLERFSPEKAEEFKKQAEIIQIEEMQRAVSIARTLVPVRTGRLRDSIQILEVDFENMRVVGGTECPYSHFVEFGTVKMHARPYWRPPVWEAFFRARRRIKELFSKMFEKGR